MQKRKDFHSMTAIEVSSYCLIILINTVIYYISFFFYWIVV